MSDRTSCYGDAKFVMLMCQEVVIWTIYMTVNLSKKRLVIYTNRLVG